MTEHADPGEPSVSADPSSTGVRVVDDAMAELTGLDEVPLPEHHERLQRAHAALQDALDFDRPTPPG